MYNEQKWHMYAIINRFHSIDTRSYIIFRILHCGSPAFFFLIYSLYIYFLKSETSQ